MTIVLCDETEAVGAGIIDAVSAANAMKCHSGKKSREVRNGSKDCFLVRVHQALPTASTPKCPGWRRTAIPKL
jgi:hypothetical protein